MKTLDTKDWVLQIHVDYHPKIYDFKADCDSCNGSGHISTMWLDESCNDCNGLGFSHVMHQREQKPTVPTKLIEALRKTYQQYLEGEFIND